MSQENNKNEMKAKDIIRISEFLTISDRSSVSKNDDESFDFDQDVDLSGKGLSEIPIKFGRVSGNFNCYDNPLTSLQGCPQEVCGNFNCSCNLLTSLDYAPEYVGRNFNCYKNSISDISTIPTKYIGGNFYARGENNTFEITDELRKIVKGDIYK